MKLGIITPTTVTPVNYKQLDLYSSSTPSKTNILRLNTYNSKEYFLVENREFVGYDEPLKYFYETNGVIAYHVNENYANNYSPSQRLVNAKDASGTNEMIDPFYYKGSNIYNKAQQTILSNATNPNNKLSDNNFAPFFLRVNSSPAAKMNVIVNPQIANGDYIIENVQSGKVIDVQGYNFGVVNLIQYFYLGENNQIFNFEKLADGSYRIMAVHSGLYLTVKDMSTANGLALIEDVWTGSDNQRFIVDESSNGQFYLHSKLSGKVIEIANGSTDDGAKVQQQDQTTSNGQLFRLKPATRNVRNHPIASPISEGYYKVQSTLNGRLLDVSGLSVNNGALLTSWFDNGGYNQIFYFKHLGNSEFSITAAHSGKALDVEAISTADGARILQWDVTRANNQIFYVEPYGNTYRLKTKHSNKVIEIKNLEIQQGTQNYTSAQLFNLLPAKVKEPPIADGDYQIVNANSKKALEVPQYNFGVVSLAQNAFNGNNNQIFNFKKLSDDSYLITAVHSSLCLDVNGNSKENGASIIVYFGTGGNNQQFFVEKNANGQFILKSKSSGKVIEIASSSVANNAKVQQNTQNNANNQLFEIIPVARNANNYPDNMQIAQGYYKIQNTKSGKMLDVSGESKDNGAAVIQWDNTIGKNQIFYLKYLGKGLFNIQASHSQKVFDIGGLSMVDGMQITQWSNNNGANQKFYVERFGSAFRLRILHSNKVIEVSNGSLLGGATIQQRSFNNTSEQLFNLIAVQP